MTLLAEPRSSSSSRARRARSSTAASSRAADAVQQHPALAVAHLAQRLRERRSCGRGADARLVELRRGRGAPRSPRVPRLVLLPSPRRRCILPRWSTSGRRRNAPALGGSARARAAPGASRGGVNRHGAARRGHDEDSMNACASTTRLRGSTTRGAGASSRTCRSTSRRRGARAGPVVELGVGTGRIAVPIAADGIHVIGVDSSPGCSTVCAGAGRARGRRARPPPRRLSRPAGRRARPARHVPVPVAAPHGRPTPTAVRALRAVRRLLAPGGRLRLRRLRARRARHRGDARPLARARAGDLRARRLGRGARERSRSRVRGASGESTMASRGCRRGVARAAREEGFAVEASTAGSTGGRTPAARTRSGSRAPP